MTSNGSEKWQIGFWVITVLVVGSFTWTTACYLTNQCRIEKNADERAKQVAILLDKYESLKQTANDCLHKIDLRLARIEDKLGIK